jgi:hypothetical protein
VAGWLGPTSRHMHENSVFDNLDNQKGQTIFKIIGNQSLVGEGKGFANLLWDCETKIFSMY